MRIKPVCLPSLHLPFPFQECQSHLNNPFVYRANASLLVELNLGSRWIYGTLSGVTSKFFFSSLVLIALKWFSFYLVSTDLLFEEAICWIGLFQSNLFPNILESFEAIAAPFLFRHNVKFNLVSLFEGTCHQWKRESYFRE